MLWLIFAFSFYGFAGPPVWFYNVPSSSMADTLLVGDVFLAAMDAYARDNPRRGDIAVFELRGTVYVKRVIGLPGDRVQMVDGKVVLNGKPVERELAADRPMGDAPDARVYRETLPGGISYETLKVEEQGFLDNTKEFKLPAGEYFVLGDNRDNSVDSRIDKMGFIPREHFLGRAVTLLFSVAPEALEWRTDRFLKPLAAAGSADRDAALGGCSDAAASAAACRNAGSGGPSGTKLPRQRTAAADLTGGGHARRFLSQAAQHRPFGPTRIRSWHACPFEN